MMKQMRKATKLVMWFVVVAFVGTIIFAWGMEFSAKSKRGKEGVIATVNDQDIMAVSFDRLLQQRVQETEKSYGEVTDQMLKSLRDQTFIEVVEQALLQQEAQKRKLTVSDKEIFEFLRRNPPREFLEAQVLQTDGKFDYNKYLQLLADPRFDWSAFEVYVRSTLAQIKLQEMVIGMARVTPEEVKRDFLERETKLAVRYIMVPASGFETQVQVSQSDIKNYYEQNKEKYKDEPRASLTYVIFPKTAAAEDEEKIKNQLLDLRKQILEGTDFKEVAIDNSQDPGTVSLGGDLGWFSSGAMVKPFEEALLKLKPGEISEPVRTNFGWHLIKLSETKKEKGVQKFHASHILLSLKPSPETLAKIKAQAEEFASQSKKAGFEKLASEKKLSIASTGFFNRNAFLKDFGTNSPAHAFAFQGKAGEISPVLETANNYVVCKLVEQKPAGVKSLAEMENYIAKELNAKKTLDLAYQKAQNIFAEIKSGKKLDEVAQTHQLKVSHTGTFTAVDANVSGVGNAPEFQGAAWALTETDRISKPVRGKFGVYIIELVSKQAPSDSVFLAQQDSLGAELLQDKQSQIYTNWLNNLKRQAKIQDFREQFFREEENL